MITELSLTALLTPDQHLEQVFSPQYFLYLKHNQSLRSPSFLHA